MFFQLLTAQGFCLFGCFFNAPSSRRVALWFFSFSPPRLLFVPGAFLFVPGAGALAPSKPSFIPRRASFLFPPPVQACFYCRSSLSGTSVQASPRCTILPAHTSSFSNSSCVIIFSFLFCRLRGGVHCFFSVAGPDRVNRPRVSLSPCRFDSAKIRPVTTRFQIIRQFHLAPRPLSRNFFPRPVPFPQSHSAPYPPLCKYRETFLSLFLLSSLLAVPASTEKKHLHAFITKHASAQIFRLKAAPKFFCASYQLRLIPATPHISRAPYQLRLISAAPYISRASIFYSHLRRQK